MSMESNQPRSTRRSGLVAGLGLCLLVGFAGCKSEKAKQAEADQQAYQQRYAKAKALFEERCKTAGVVIHRTVKDVEGIELTKIRPEIPWGGREYFDPMFPAAAMAAESQGKDYIKQFLFDEIRDVAQPERRGTLSSPHFKCDSRCLPPLRGYRFVEYSDAATGQRIRATLSRDPATERASDPLERQEVQRSHTRFALDFEDLVDPIDRSHWVAGTRLKVIDKQTGEVIAQMTRFVWDPGFGLSTSGRWPWQHADGGNQRCPNELYTRGHISRYFADRVLQPKQGDQE